MALLGLAAIATEAGTVTAALLLESEIVRPPAPATLASVTVHVDVAPEVRPVGVHETELKATGATSDNEAVCELRFHVAVTCAV